MSTTKESRQHAFTLFVQYDIKANQCENLVSKLEYQVFKANSGIEDNTVRYHDNESFLSMWYDWYNEYERDIIEYARKLGFINERYPTTALEFDDTKYGLDIFYDYWIREGMNNYEFRINTKDSAGRFFPSSKLCNCCGEINKDLKLSDRIYRCDCGNIIDRDYQASLNLKQYGENVLKQNL